MSLWKPFVSRYLEAGNKGRKVIRNKSFYKSSISKVGAELTRTNEAQKSKIWCKKNVEKPQSSFKDSSHSWIIVIVL